MHGRGLLYLYEEVISVRLHPRSRRRASAHVRNPIGESSWHNRSNRAERIGQRTDPGDRYLDLVVVFDRAYAEGRTAGNDITG